MKGLPVSGCASHNRRPTQLSGNVAGCVLWQELCQKV
jgi:hypothetical protein